MRVAPSRPDVLDGPDEALRSGVAGYTVVAAHYDRDVGLLVLGECEHDKLAYLGIDIHGRSCRQPAANEALWDAANKPLRGAPRTS